MYNMHVTYAWRHDVVMHCSNVCGRQQLFLCFIQTLGTFPTASEQAVKCCSLRKVICRERTQSVATFLGTDSAQKTIMY